MLSDVSLFTGDAVNDFDMTTCGIGTGSDKFHELAIDIRFDVFAVQLVTTFGTFGFLDDVGFHSSSALTPDPSPERCAGRGESELVERGVGLVARHWS